MELLSNSYFALFLIISLGFILGNIRIKGISLDVSAVIFVALFFGHFGVQVPKDFQNIGLLLFIFTIGIQAGPGFFQSFKKGGVQLVLMPIVLILVAGVSTAILVIIFRIDPKIAVGLFTGALTSTPGLAAAIDSTNSSLASIGYGVAYPFGVIGVILFVRFLPKLLHVRTETAEKEIKKKTLEEYPEILSKNFIVENQIIFGKTIGELNIRSMTGASISRVLTETSAIAPSSETTLNKGDLIKAVGTEEALGKVKLLIGSETNREIPFGKDYEVQSILVTNKKVINKTIGQLNLLSGYNATITRIRRSGINITPSFSSHIRFGDKLMIACDKEHMKGVIRLLGNDDKKLSNTNFFPIAAGIVLGVLLSKIKISFSDSFTFSPGLTGGVLIVALILGYFGKTGPVIWTMSGNANQLLRQLGLLFFLATVGTHAGEHLAETYHVYGIKLFYIGAIITVIPMFVSALFAHYTFKMNLLIILGVLTGGMTSTPGLAAVDSMTETNTPHVAYAAVYPIAMVFIIICVQILTQLPG